MESEMPKTSSEQLRKATDGLLSALYEAIVPSVLALLDFIVARVPRRT